MKGKIQSSENKLIGRKTTSMFDCLIHILHAGWGQHILDSKRVLISRMILQFNREFKNARPKKASPVPLGGDDLFSKPGSYHKHNK